jgi:hypothetical protein
MATFKITLHGVFDRTNKNRHRSVQSVKSVIPIYHYTYLLLINSTESSQSARARDSKR